MIDVKNLPTNDDLAKLSGEQLLALAKEGNQAVISAKKEGETSKLQAARYLGTVLLAAQPNELKKGTWTKFQRAACSSESSAQIYQLVAEHWEHLQAAKKEGRPLFIPLAQVRNYLTKTGKIIRPAGNPEVETKENVILDLLAQLVHDREIKLSKSGAKKLMTFFKSINSRPQDYTTDKSSVLPLVSLLCEHEEFNELCADFKPGRLIARIEPALQIDPALLQDYLLWRKSEDEKKNVKAAAEVLQKVGRKVKAKN